MDVESQPNRYEWLQVLLAVLLGYANVALWLFAWTVVYAPWPIVPLITLTIGGLEIKASRKMSRSLTRRSVDAPTSIRSALSGLGGWLLGVGIITVVVSAGALAVSIALIATI